ncbi:MAG: GTP 3',8-cyclase MoaA [Spirochaetes bacterium]|jgi:cyclic pyranopterin phosphate synthase|nr:GTP 3',8-cyclase MoaA [Spirochaetota bacterium]
MLTDSFFRNHNYLRISITDKCNLRCVYCIPPEGVALLSHDEVLRNEEFIRLSGIFVSMGVTKIRYTGGEPLLRKGFMNIVETTRDSFPDLDLCLTTNATLLPEFIDDLYRLRVRKLNISLDSLDRRKYAEITGSDRLEDVLSSTESAIKKNFFDIKINAVLFESTLTEIRDFLGHFRGSGVTLRFIERMPFTEEDERQRFIPAEKLVATLGALGSLERLKSADTGVAAMYKLSYGGSEYRIGIIPPVTHKFCDRCNRLRLTSDGMLKTCLYSEGEIDLKRLLREGAVDEDIKKAVTEALKTKKVSHDLDKKSYGAACRALPRKNMSKIGG